MTRCLAGVSKHVPVRQLADFEKIFVKAGEKKEVQVRKRYVLSRFLYVTMIILPRQARDKHRENSKKR